MNARSHEDFYPDESKGARSVTYLSDPETDELLGIVHWKPPERQLR